MISTMRLDGCSVLGFISLSCACRERFHQQPSLAFWKRFHRLGTDSWRLETLPRKAMSKGLLSHRHKMEIIPGGGENPLGHLASDRSRQNINVKGSENGYDRR